VNPSIGDPVLNELHHPAVIDRAEEITDVCVQHPVHARAHDDDPQRIQRIVLAASGPEPVREPLKVLFVDGVEDCHDRMLDDFVLQGRDAQGALPSIRFRDVGSP
jgi:hypothetical protein